MGARRAGAAAEPHPDRSRLPRASSYIRADFDATTFEAVVVEALNFDIPLVEVEPHLALELFHGPTLVRTSVCMMARLMAALDTAEQPLTTRGHLR